MNIALRVQLPNNTAESVTWTRVIENGRILVSHGQFLYKIAFATQQIENRLKVSEQLYDGRPVAYFDNHYYEISEKSVQTWDMQTFKETQKYELTKPLIPGFLKNCAYLQLDRYILIISAQFILEFDVKQLQYTVIAQAPVDCAPLVPCAIMRQVQSQFLLGGNGSGTVFDTFRFKFARYPLECAAAGECASQLKDNKYIITGVKGLYTFDLQTNTQTLVCDLDDISGCTLVTAGPYFLVTSRHAELLIIQSELAQEALQAQTELQLNIPDNSTFAGVFDSSENEPESISNQGTKSLETTSNDQPTACKNDSNKTLPGFEQLSVSTTTELPTEENTVILESDNNEALVRQGDKLLVLNLQRFNIVGQLDMDQYKHTPIGVHNGCYYELPAGPEDYMKVVDVDSLNYKEEQCKIFPVSLEHASYCQIGDYIIIVAKGVLMTYDLENLEYQVLSKERVDIDTQHCNMIVGQDEIKCYCKDGILTFNMNTLDYKIKMVKSCFQPDQLIQLRDYVITREGGNVNIYSLTLEASATLYTAGSDLTGLSKCNALLIVQIGKTLYRLSQLPENTLADLSFKFKYGSNLRVK